MAISDDELQILIEKIALDHNWDLNGYKMPTLKRRLMMRVNLSKCSSIEEYYELLTEDEDEYRQLINSLTVNYTYWFRDEFVWNEILKILYKKAMESDKPIRIWSAGCATGEEPYSLAILCKKVAELTDKDVAFQIYASDIDDVALRKARDGVFDKTRVNLDDDEIEKYFEEVEGGYKIHDEFRNMIRFSKIDLAKDPLPGRLDIILCRNVMIYFNKPLQDQIYQDFYYALHNDGYLITGTTENLPNRARGIFETVDMEHHIYRKK